MHNAAVGGVPNSDHLTGNTYDFVPQGMSMQDAYARIQASGAPIKQALNEGNHIHVAFDPSKTPPVDDVDAMLAAHASGASAASSPQADPIDAALAAQAASNPAAAAPAALPQKNQGPAPGTLESFARSAANGLTFNLAPNLAAVADAALPRLSQHLEPYNVSQAPSFGQRYTDNLAFQRGQDKAAMASHPVASIAGSVTGGLANPVARALPVPKTVGGAALQGAGLGSLYGFGGGEGGFTNRANSAGIGALTGGATGAAFGGLSKVIAGATPTPEAQDLLNMGANLTTGQRLGGTFQRAEEGATSIPTLGDTIKSRQFDATVGYNRGLYNDVLDPLGVKLPSNIPAGNKAIDALGNTIGRAYDTAYTGAAANYDKAMQQDIQAAIHNATLEMPQNRVAMLQNAVNEKIVNRLDPNGNLAGDELQAAKNWFSQKSRALASAADPEQRALGDAYGSVLDSLKGSISRVDPQRGAMLKAADEAYARFVRVSGAASSNNASGKEGIFSANQFGQAVRSADKSVRKTNFAKGNALMQDLAQSGQQVLTPTVPDSGTPFRTFIQDPLRWPIALPAVVPAMAYSKTGQAVVNGALFGAPKTRAALSQIPRYMLPGALPLLGTQAAQ